MLSPIGVSPSYPQDDLALTRIINNPKRGFGQQAMQQLQNKAQQNHLSLHDCLRQSLSDNSIKGKAYKTMSLFYQQWQTWQSAMKTTAQEQQKNLARQILTESGYLQQWQESTSLTASSKLENIEELLRALSNYLSIEHFIEHVNLLTQTDDRD